MQLLSAAGDAFVFSSVIVEKKSMKNMKKLETLLNFQSIVTKTVLFFSLHRPEMRTQPLRTREENTEKNRFSLNRPREAEGGVDN